ncbi:MAG: MEMO1 family protein [Methanosarcinales archaeon]|nr:MEMO1 family protein [ANME-2 cluster archaeon]MDF1531036.1 MEMO1 family protein [ANME-2 cluster archaeon]MDW7775492.1 MEMO1 family protein [Methanosarcinales archaeon]
MRRSAVAGQFYPGTQKQLKRELNRCFAAIVDQSRQVIGAVVPHAGYTYSGPTAAHVYATLPQADTYVILGPNHTGVGSLVAVSQESWETPLGEVPADKEFAKQLAGGIIDLDENAHRHEHSIEVQLPFLQYRFSHRFEIVPICMGMQDEQTAMEVGDQLAQVIRNSNKKVVIIASSDFSHYVPDNVARDTDNYLIESVLSLDVDEFYARLAERNASACGYGPITAMLAASAQLGAIRGTLLDYSTSGDVTGDLLAVVGYAGIIVE